MGKKLESGTLGKAVWSCLSKTSDSPFLRDGVHFVTDKVALKVAENSLKISRRRVLKLEELIEKAKELECDCE